MKKKIFMFITIFLIIVIVLFIGYLSLPLFEFRNDNKLYVFTREESFGEFEENQCYSENVSYNKKRDISITSWDIKELPLGIYMLILEYEDGNLCNYEYILEEEYILSVIEKAEITDNSSNINLEELIEGREAIVSNKRYLGNEYDKAMYYILDGREEVLYIFYVDDLLVIQVGYSDEGPRFIAYK
ncbi:MAG: hypothetical protein IJN90_08060 [Bacilli bacterium]|nr:hypothetical protein [Bacilli bacterium]